MEAKKINNPMSNTNEAIVFRNEDLNEGSDS